MEQLHEPVARLQVLRASRGDISTYLGYPGGPSTTLPNFTPGPSTSIPWSAIPTKESLLVILLANETRMGYWNCIWINKHRLEMAQLLGLPTPWPLV
jgi:hypothetical protein